MDFEEEMGSPNLPPAVPVHREALQADMLIMLDGPRHYSNRPTLTFGLAGLQLWSWLFTEPGLPSTAGTSGIMPQSGSAPG